VYLLLRCSGLYSCISFLYQLLDLEVHSSEVRHLGWNLSFQCWKRKETVRSSMKHLIDATIVSVNRIPVSQDKVRHFVSRFPCIMAGSSTGWSIFPRRQPVSSSFQLCYEKQK
jgi:hypothetical protein